MQYREYGKTGKKLSVIGFGGMRFGKDEDYAQEVMHRANELGVNYFDTAPFYCDDRSEIIFGKAFRNMPKDFYVSTKSSLSAEPTADAVRARIEKSLKRLGREKIDFYHMWCIKDLEQYRGVMAPGGPYEGALKAKEEGLIEHLVFSTHCKGEDIRTIVEEDHFEGVLLGYNVSNYPFRQEGVDAAREKNIGVVTMNPLGGGLIPQHKEFFDFIRENDKETVNQAALRFILAQEGITLAIPGMGTIEEVEENVAVGDFDLSVSPGKLKEIETNITDSMNTLCTTCGYCLKCPKDIKIHQYLESYNLKLLKDEEEMKKRLQMLKDSGRLKEDDAKPGDCIACGICEDLCTQKLPIIQRLKELDQIGML